VAEAYRDHNLDVKRNVVKDATRELKNLMTEWEEKYLAASQAVRDYESAHDLGTIPNTRKANDERLSTLSTELTRTRIDKIQLQSRVATLKRYKKLKDLESIQAAELLRDPLLQQLRTQLAQLEADLAGLQSNYLEQHPKVLELTQRRDSLHASARQHITNLVKSVTKELRRVRNVEAGLDKELEKARLADRSIADIERGYTVLAEVEKQSQTQFDEIRNRYVETTMSAQVETNNVRVLESATNAKVIWPRKRMVMAFAVGIALIIALILAALLEYADSTIKSWEELQDKMGLKVLGVLPVIDEEEEEEVEVGSDGEIIRRRFRDLFIHKNRRSHVAEAFRAVRTNLLFMSTTRPLNSLMVTSADPSEGKSTIAINTSVAMAISGSKVLLVEADMRRPRLRKTFGLDGERGLTTCLAGTGSISEDIQLSDVENLHVLPCGPLPPNPAELLHTERFMAVKAEMESVYDIVIFDSPPVNPVADALVLGGKVDACLVVVRAHRTSRHALQNALRQLQDVGIPILGSVLNHREVPKNSYKYRGQGYGYGYGYSYGKGEGYGYESLEEEEVS
jgi:capsular exopolysaccharide synthesis family protein